MRNKRRLLPFLGKASRWVGDLLVKRSARKRMKWNASEFDY
jgi:hypothetical protein